MDVFLLTTHMNDGCCAQMHIYFYFCNKYNWDENNVHKGLLLLIFKQAVCPNAVGPARQTGAYFLKGLFNKW